MNNQNDTLLEMLHSDSIPDMEMAANIVSKLNEADIIYICLRVERVLGWASLMEYKPIKDSYHRFIENKTSFQLSLLGLKPIITTS